MKGLNLVFLPFYQQLKLWANLMTIWKLGG